MYTLDILIQGYPGKTVHHGGLGWSTVPLLRGHGEVILIDTGSYGYRDPLLEQLDHLGLGREDVTSVVLTQCHGLCANRRPRVGARAAGRHLAHTRIPRGEARRGAEGGRR